MLQLLIIAWLHVAYIEFGWGEKDEYSGNDK